MEKLSAMNITTQFNLLDLPNELISQVLEFVENASTLRLLASTCHRMQELAEPILYRHILLRTRVKADSVLKSLGARPERALAVRQLDFPCDSYYMQDMTLVAPLISKSKGLTELMIESPSCNETEFEAEEVWKPMTDRLFHSFQAAVLTIEPSVRPLQKLAKLTLHLNGPKSPYWTLDHRSLPVFLHPTLQEIKVSCMNLNPQAFEKIQERSRTTPLKYLTLEECNIRHQGLAGLLSLPKALETLYLGENCHNVRNFENIAVSPYCAHLFKLDPTATLAALAQQRHSLRSLTYVTRGIKYFRDQFFGPGLPTQAAAVDAGFADFNALESITLIGTCTSFERAVLSSRPPPNLRELTFQQDLNPLWPLPTLLDDDLDNESVIALIPFFRAPSASVPSILGTFNMVCEYSGGPQDYSVSVDARRGAIRRAAKAISETHGVKTNMKYHYRGHYFPPFLYGEPRPKEGLMYDGAADRFAEQDRMNVGIISGSVWSED